MTNLYNKYTLMMNKTSLSALVQITKGLKILYIEDNEESMTQALKMFHNYFEYIDTAIDGEQGLEKYKNYYIDTNRYYDLVITDIEMPKMNGIELSKAIYGINKEQKIIVVSAYSDKKYFIDLINLGIDGFMQKPFSFEQTAIALSEFAKSFTEDSLINISQHYSYNISSNYLFCNNKQIKTTINENKFIGFLIKNKDNSSSSLEDIFNYIYYDQPQKEFSADSIKGLVKRLRKKLPFELILHDRTQGYSLIK